jgi:uncharacterized protein YggU (UPF0235/DUF167 family)
MPGSEIALRVTPSASREQVTLDGSRFVIRVTFVPEDGKASKAVTRLLAKALGVAPSRLVLVRGSAGRDKVFRVEQGGGSGAFFLADLTRVKSVRACLPMSRRVPRQPRQARTDFRASGLRMAPCLRACALRKSDPAKVHWTFAFGSSGTRETPRPSLSYVRIERPASSETASCRFRKRPAGDGDRVV